MRTVTHRPAFQGDLMIRRIDASPAGLKKVDGIDGQHLVAHSETGHHHVVDAGMAQRFIDNTNEFISYLEVASETELKHLRNFDTHETLALEPGTYEVRHQRSYTPEGFRRVED